MPKSINATHYDRIPAFPNGGKKKKRVVNAIIETPKSSCYKYALVPEYGIIAFHRVLPGGLEWPYDYGFVPQTLAPDGDALDILVISEKGLFSGCLIAVRVIGSVRQKRDDIENDRLIAVPVPSQNAAAPTDAWHELSDVPHSDMEDIKRFLVSYPVEEGHRVEMTELVNSGEALKSVRRYMKCFRKRNA